MKIRKAVLPVAGRGTRFFPASKTVPKEMFPIGGKPVIQWLVEEAVKSGIEEIIFVLSPDKSLIRKYFSRDQRLEQWLISHGKKDAFRSIAPLHKLARFYSVIQREPLGDGDAILKAEKLVANEPFLVLFGDDLVQSKIPAAKQLMDQFNGESIMAVQRVRRQELSSYGVIGIGKKKGRLMQVKSLIEKPAPSKAPSDFGIIGKYVCTPAIFDALCAAKPQGNELRLIDGFKKLSESEKIWAWQIHGKRFDTGRPEGLREASLFML